MIELFTNPVGYMQAWTVIMIILYIRWCCDWNTKIKTQSVFYGNNWIERSVFKLITLGAIWLMGICAFIPWYING